jgi:signal peptidase II
VKKAIFIILLVLIIDQLTKIYIKTTFRLNEHVLIFGQEWARIHFTENKGAAWGVQLNKFLTFLSEDQAKIILTVFRIFAISGIGYWLYTSIKSNAKSIFIIALSLIFAGALGNIIDSLIYGIIFDQSTYKQVATMFPENGGYSSLFHGKVVDMFYFPMWSGNLPSWLGGKYFTFFNAIFNIADAAISIGVVIMILFNKTIFNKK